MLIFLNSKAGPSEGSQVTRRYLCLKTIKDKITVKKLFYG